MLSARVSFTLFVATHVSIRASDTSSKPHGSPSQAYRTLRYHSDAEGRGQMTEDRKRSLPTDAQARQHFRHDDIPFAELRSRARIQISQIASETQPHLHFVA